MSIVQLPFPAEYLGYGRWQAPLEPIWDAAKSWCQEQGLKKEPGHFQGAPAPM